MQVVARGRWVGRLPAFIHVSYGKMYARPNRPLGDTWLVRSDMAHRYPLVGIVRPLMNADTGVRLRKMVAVDVDRPFDETLAAFSTGGVPLPGFAVRNTWSDHSHCVWRLNDVHEELVWEAVRSLQFRLNALLGGDPGYTSTTVRNPFVPEANLIWGHDVRWFDPYRRWDVEELLDACPEPSYSQVESLREVAESTGRNSALNSALFLAKRRDPGLNLAMAADVMNAKFDPPLPHGEVRAVVRSVEMAWKRQQRRGHRGDLDVSLLH